MLSSQSVRIVETWHMPTVLTATTTIVRHAVLLGMESHTDEITGLLD